MTKTKAPGVMKRNYYTVKPSDVGEDWIIWGKSWWLFSRIFGRVVSADDVGKRLYMIEPGSTEHHTSMPVDDEHTTLTF